MSTHLNKHVKTQFPTINVHFQQEHVANDNIYSDGPTVDYGDTHNVTMVQIHLFVMYLV